MTTTTDFLSPVIHRIQCRNDALRALEKSFQMVEEADDRIGQAETTRFDTSLEDVRAAGSVVQMVMRGIKDKLDADLSQAGFLIAREYIVEPARESEEPVCWITGNRYFPPLRTLSPVEEIYQADIGPDEGHLFSLLIEAIENKCREEGIMMECPEDDNSVYAVDLRRWEYIGPDQDAATTPADSYNSEWRAKDGRN